MTTDRIDELLQRSLETGAIPADATAAERAELAPLLASAAALKLNAARIASEADAAMPVARARFQRHLAGERAATVSPTPTRTASNPAPRPGLLGRLFGGRTLALGGAVAAMAVVAIIGIVVLQPFSSVETASALTVDDYVQVEGVVSANDGSTMTVQSPIVGDIEISLSDQTAVSGDEGELAAASLRAGDPVLVSGIVTARRAIAASNVAVARKQSTPVTGVEGTVRQLKQFREGLTGAIRVLSLSPDGTRARVLLATPNEPLLVDIDGRSMDQFLAANPRPLGAVVRIVEAPGAPRGVFHIEPAPATSATPGPSPSGPQFESVRGVVLSRTANLLMVRTDRGVVPVALRKSTTVRFSDSGLTVEEILTGQAVVGHEVSVSGNQEAPGSRRVVATLIVVLGKPE